MLKKPSSTISSFFGAFFLSLLSLAFWFFLYYKQIGLTPKGVIGGDTADYAQIAKNLFQNKGYTSNVAFAVPLDFYRTINRLTPPWPDIWRDPFLTTNIALMYKIFGVNDFAVIFTSGIYYFLTTLMIFFAAKNVSNTKTAIIASISWTTFTGAIYLSFTGYKEPPAAFLVSLMILLLTASQKKKIIFFFLGINLGLYYLLKNSLAMPFILSIAIYSFVKSKQSLFLLLTGIFIITLPWLIRNYQVAKNPIFNISQNCSIPSNIIDFPDTPQDICFRFPLIEVAPFFKTHIKEMLIKYFFGVRELLISLPSLVPGIPVFIISSFWIGYFLQEKNTTTRDLRLIFLCSIFLQIITMPIGQYATRLFFPNAPVIIILGIITLFSILERFKRRGIIIIGIISFSILQSFILTKEVMKIGNLFSTRVQTVDEGNYQMILFNEASFIKNYFSNGKVLVASFPFEVSLYGDVSAIQILPENFSFNQLRRLHEEYIPFNGIYINWRHLHNAWPIPWWDNNNLPNFQLVKKFDSGSVILQEFPHPADNLLKDPDSFSGEKINLENNKNYFFSLLIYSPREYPESGPITINFHYYNFRGNLLVNQEIGDTSLRKDRWNYLSERLMPPPQTKYVEIQLKVLQENQLKLKNAILEEVYWEQGL